MHYNHQIKYRIRRCLVPHLNDRDFAKLGGGGLDKGDFYFPIFTFKKILKKNLSQSNF